MLIAAPDIPEGGSDVIAKNIMLAPAAEPMVAFAHKHAAKKANANNAMKASETGKTTLQIARPHPLYTTSIAHLGQDFLKSAVLTAWQYVIIEGGSPQAVAETRRRESTLSLSYAALYGISYAEEMVRTIGAAEALPQVAVADYELRILRAPSLSLLAVWLHGPTDLLLPIKPAPANLKPMVAITEDQLSTALAPLADVRRTISDRG